jgi:hypothetical protein
MRIQGWPEAAAMKTIMLITAVKEHMQTASSGLLVGFCIHI